MSEKSYVTLERRVCLVCGQQFDTGALLMDQRLRPTFDMHTCTGWGLCPEHQKLHEQGYVALIECDPEKSGVTASTDRIDQDQAYRTGRIAHMKRSVFDQFFNKPSPSTPIVFIDPQAMQAVIDSAPAQE